METAKSRRIENSLIGSRIQFFQAQEFVKPDTSPMLTSLWNDKEGKVKKVLELYEKKPWCAKTGVNWWVNGNSPALSYSSKVSGTGQANFDYNKHLADLLLHNQRQIGGIQKIISRVSEIVGQGPGFMAMKLRDYNFYLFGDLEAIYSLHKNLNKTFALQEDGETNEKYINYIKSIVQLMDEGKFQCYVTHKMLERTMLKLHDDFIFINSKDREHFDVFYALDCFQQSIAHACDALMKNPAFNADDTAICLDAERKLLNLIDLVSDAGHVSRISQIIDVPMDVHFKIFDIVKKKQHRLKNPMLLLVPMKINAERGQPRCPIDVLQLGKFIRTIQCPELILQKDSKMSVSKFFIFEYCVMHTVEVGFNNTFCFKEYFWIRNATFRGEKDKGRVAELVNDGAKIQIADSDMVALLMALRKKHRVGEIRAEIEMTDSEVLKIAESIEDLKNWRRHTIISHP